MAKNDSGTYKKSGHPQHPMAEKASKARVNRPSVLMVEITREVPGAARSPVFPQVTGPHLAPALPPIPQMTFLIVLEVRDNHVPVFRSTVCCRRFPPTPALRWFVPTCRSLGWWLRCAPSCAALLGSLALSADVFGPCGDRGITDQSSLQRSCGRR